MLEARNTFDLLFYAIRLLSKRPSLMLVLFGYTIPPIFFLYHLSIKFVWPLTDIGWGVANFLIVIAICSVIVSFFSFLTVAIAEQIETASGEVNLFRAIPRAARNTIRVFPLSLTWAVEWSLFSIMEFIGLLILSVKSNNSLSNLTSKLVGGAIASGAYMAKAGIRLNAFLVFPLAAWQKQGIGMAAALSEVISEKYSKMLFRIYWPGELIFLGSIAIGFSTAYLYIALGKYLPYTAASEVYSLILSSWIIFGFSAHAFTAQITVSEVCLFVMRSEKNRGKPPSLLDNKREAPLDREELLFNRVSAPSWRRTGAWARIVVMISVGVIVPVCIHAVLKADAERNNGFQNYPHEATQQLSPENEK